MMLVKWVSYMQKNENWSKTLHRSQSKHTKDLNIRRDTLNLREKKVEDKFELFGKSFLNRTPKAQAARPAVDRQELVKLKRVYTAKDPVIRTKQQSPERDKIFSSYLSDSRGLVSGTHKRRGKEGRKESQIEEQDDKQFN